MGILIIPHPKEKNPKLIYLLDEDVEFLKSIPRGLPELPFFRHEKGLKGVRGGAVFGPRYLYKWWKKACKEVGVEDIDLYGGTRHSTVTALSKSLTREEIKKGTMHSTNKAFERYFQKQSSDAKMIYQEARNLQSDSSDNLVIFGNVKKT